MFHVKHLKHREEFYKMDFIDSTLDKKEEHCALFNGYI